MKYTVSINEEMRSITVTLADGTKGVAKCCPTDCFDINAGTLLALERAKVASKAKSEPAPAPANLSVMELVKALEKALPKGEMVVVGNGETMTEKQKEFLVFLAGVSTKYHCDCPCCDDDEDDGYDDGYADGYADAEEELAETETKVEELESAIARMREVLAEIAIM